MKIKICDLAPGSACSFYRAIGPLANLSQIRCDIQIEYISGVGWHTIADGDIIFFSRPAVENYKQSIQLAKSYKKPVWIDYDDCMHEIPPDNPAHKFHSQPAIQKNVLECLALADVVTVATPGLKEYYKKYNDNIIVIENAFNDYNFDFKKVDRVKTIINWRGSKTHNEDISTCEEEIVELAKKYPKWCWSWIGDGTWFVHRKISNRLVMPEINYITAYFEYIKNLSPAICIVPLTFNIFNECKSNISYQEATYSGAATLAPDMPEFRKPGITLFSNNKEFKQNLEMLINDKSFRDSQYDQSFEYIQKNLLLSNINKKRLKVIKDLLK